MRKNRTVQKDVVEEYLICDFCGLEIKSKKHRVWVEISHIRDEEQYPDSRFYDLHRTCGEGLERFLNDAKRN